MTRKAVVYDDDTGSIERVMTGAVPVENQRLPGGKSILTDDDADLSDLTDKMVDTSTTPPSVVDDPDFNPPSDPNADLKQRYRDATTTDEKLDVLFELVTGEQP